MTMHSSRTSPSPQCAGNMLLLLLLLLSSSTPSSAELVFIGKSHTFGSCPRVPQDPIFEFRAHGNVNFVNYAIGEILRTGHPVGRFGFSAAGDGSEITYNLTGIVGADGGLYKCDNGPENTRKFNLTVIDSKTVCPTSLGPVNTGEKLVGECSLQKMGSDDINVKWRHTDIIQDSVSTVEATKVISKLDIVASPSLNGQQFTCFMDDVEGVAPCTVTAEVNYPPQNVEITPKVQAKLWQQEAIVTCIASDANPNNIVVKFRVKKGTDGVYEDADPALVNGTVLKLVVDDDYSVKCEANNGILGMETNSTGEAIINMITPAKISGDLAQSPLPAVVGNLVNVTCPVEPNMAQVTWSKNGKEVSKDKILTLTAERADLDAVIVCHAQVDDPNFGVDDPGVSANLTLKVEWPPTKESAVDNGPDKNGVMSRTIVVSGNPPPNVTVIKVNGTFNETIGDPSDNQVTVTIVYKEEDLPIEYQVLAEGLTEPVASGKILAPTKPTTETETKTNNAGTIAGIIIAVILICICAALLIIMWKKNLLCPKKGSLDVEKGTSASSEGGLSKPVELEEVEPQVHEPVEETQNKSAAPLLDDDDIKKPPVYENGQTEIIPTNSPSESFDDQPPAAPGTPPPPPPPLASPE